MNRATVRNTPSFNIGLDMRNISRILRKVNKHGKAPGLNWGLWGKYLADSFHLKGDRVHNYICLAFARISPSFIPLSCKHASTWGGEYWHKEQGEKTADGDALLIF
jgi:hypothetical protein